MTEISFQAQLISNKPQFFSANADASLNKMIPALIEALDSGNKDKSGSNYKVLIAFQLTDPDTLLETMEQDLSDSNLPLSELEWEISNSEMKIRDLELEPIKDESSRTSYRIINKDMNLRDLKLKLRSSLTSFQDLHIKNGFYILLSKSTKGNFRLKVTLPNQMDRIFDPGSELLIGRLDIEKGIKPDLDLTPYLKNPLRVSRQLAWFFEEDERWKIKLHPESNSTVFIDNQRLEKNKSYEVRDETEIKFGNEIENPELRIIVAPYVN